MSRIRSRRPSPAMAVAFVALVAALSGSAVALPGSNGVNSGDIKNNSIKSKDVRNNSLTGKDVKNLGGGDINEASLGKVPSAANADSAASAANAANAATAGTLANTSTVFKRSAQSASNDDNDAARAAATKVPLGSAGPFSIYGKCFQDADDSDLNVAIFIETSQAGGTVGGYSASYWYGDLGPASDEADRQLVSTTAGDNNEASSYDYSNFSAIAADGLVLTANVGVYVKQGTLPDGNGVFGEGNQCIFRYEQEKVSQVTS